ncbi:hypothetical protein B296_00043300 [Ensete ventricosum]|uniref:Uncharacterized protein n=1 Tax=Ensete ventricosum TaxID=4639 RepID=A0A426XP44_ENSVE|nr:hypothetical protein B296_00043300 [Ensete ventricosum]
MLMVGLKRFAIPCSFSELRSEADHACALAYVLLVCGTFEMVKCLKASMSRCASLEKVLDHRHFSGLVLPTDWSSH